MQTFRPSSGFREAFQKTYRRGLLLPWRGWYMKDELRQEMLKKAVEGNLSCATARKIAEDLKLPYQEVGKAANELGIRIKSCQLGCF